MCSANTAASESPGFWSMLRAMPTFILRLLYLEARLGRRDPSPATACGAHCHLEARLGRRDPSPATACGAHCHHLAAARDASKSTPRRAHRDRKSTRLNSSHLGISYAVFC